MPWRHGRSLLGPLELVDIESNDAQSDGQNHSAVSNEVANALSQ